MYRQIFEEHYPSASAAATVPGGPSIACSTAKAIEWDESFKLNADQSGRSVIGVHETAYEEKKAKAGKSRL
jgi:asparagine synthase (glutamine-hydrolysing)